MSDRDIPEERFDDEFNKNFAFPVDDINSGPYVGIPKIKYVFEDEHVAVAAPQVMIAQQQKDNKAPGKVIEPQEKPDVTQQEGVQEIKQEQ